MEKTTLFSILFILSCLNFQSAWCDAIGTSEIKCAGGSMKTVGDVLEGYEGDVEFLTNIRPEDRLELEEHLFPIGVTFLELDYTEGESTATIRTRKPLDADALKGVGEKVFYSVTCRNTGLQNQRTLNVLDVNDNPPVFEHKTYSETVSETLSVNSDVLRVKATDADVSPENSRITYSILPPAPAEFVLRSDGIIRLTQRLNYNNNAAYTFTVEAKDKDEFKDTATVTITVEDFDNLNPYFDYSLYQASIMENQAGQFSTVSPEAIKAQDGDTGINEPVIYSITAVFPNEYQTNFEIDPNSGVISVVTSLDREEVELITIYMQAVQQDDSSKTANAVVSVTVEDVDDNSPKFEQDQYTVDIPENSPQDQFVLQTRVTDLDQGGFVGSFRIIPDSVPFSISSDGTIRVKSSAELDREITSSFSFQVEAQENPPSSNMATANVNIVLLDENDNSPQFATSKYEGKVYSNQTTGMPVIKVEATDLDEGQNGEISYTIEFGNDDGYFGINENDGQITLVNTITLMENTILNFSLYVTAKDGGAISRSTSAMVEVKAPGDSRPQFLQKIYQGQVEEEKSGANIVKVDFLSIYPVVPVNLMVESEDDKFSIDQNTGVLSTKVKLDFEVQKSYTVQLSISDGTNRDEASVQVEVLDINDNDPVFESNPVTVDIPEDLAMGDTVSSVKAMDADDGFNGEVRYTLQGGAARFSVDQETGVITVAAPLDRETQDEYSLEIIAQDQGRPSRSSTTTLDISVTDINDNAPIFSKQQYEATVSEHATVGTDVVKVAATDKDKDVNSIVTYHIVMQEPSSTPPVFSIDAVSGTITLAEALDYGKVKKYTLEVEGRDGGSPALTGSAAVNVWVQDINDKAPQFSMNEYDVSVYENLAGGAALVSLEVTDEDEGGFSQGYFLLDSDTFDINSQGVVLLKSDVTLDRETTDSYIIQVIAVDQPVDGLSATAQVKITVLDVNDNNPEFLPLPDNIEIQEGLYTPSSPGEVCVISATDADTEDNGRVTISTSSFSELFSLREDGTLLAVEELDRETQDVYDLVIVAMDHGMPQRNSITTVRVSITDVNDNTPVFSKQQYEATVSEHATVGTDVVNVAANDKDEGANGIVTYHIVKQEPSSTPPVFSIDAVSGTITLAETLDYGKVKKYTLEVEGRDGGSPALTGSAAVNVWVEDVNDKAPQFSSEEYDVSVYENLADGAALVSLEVTDEDEGGFSQGYFILDSDTFVINSQGVVMLKSGVNLDRETKDNYMIQVIAVDQPVDGLSSTAQVKITVLDVNDNNPEFLALPDHIEILEGAYTASSPGEVCVISAIDADIGDNGRVTISTSSHSALFSFKEDGTLLAVEELDRETQDLYNLVIVAMDHGMPQRNNITTLRVSITDVNDNAPVFSSDTYSQSILVKDAKVGDLLLTLSATDKDAGRNSLIIFSFLEDSSMVTLDPETGDITLASDLSEVTEDTLLTLTAKATDHGTPPKSATAEVLIYLKLVSVSEGVAFVSSSYSFSIKENEPEATEVGVVKASAGDPLHTVSYNMKSHKDIFSVDADGTIKALIPLDKEEEEWYIIRVEAKDSRTPPNTAEATVSVQVENVNEAPVFDAENYKAEIFRISPYKFPIVKVQASDPDVGESSELQYTLLKSTSLLDVDGPTGQLYVLDATSFEGSQTCEVKATDKHGLSTTTTVQVVVKPSETDSVVVISINQPVFSVEKKIPEIQDSLTRALGWTVSILSARADNGNEMRSVLRETTTKTYVRFIATSTSGTVISATDVKEKLQREQNAVTAELENVFGPGLEISVEESSEDFGDSEDSNQAVVIALGILLGVSTVGLIVLATVFVIRFKKLSKDTYSDKESFNIGKDESFNTFTNPAVSTTKEEQVVSRRDSEKEYTYDRNENGISSF